MKKVYLTGATGFLGETLIKLAPPTLQIHPISGRSLCAENPRIGLQPGSHIVHLAGRVHVMKETAADPLGEFRKSNVVSTLALAKAAIESGAHTFIYASSIAVFGRFRGGFLPDDAIPQPDDPYGQSKFEAETGLARLFANSAGTRCVILRLPMVYGPGNKGNMLPLLKMAARGIPLPLGGATGKRSMLYAGNFASSVFSIIDGTSPSRPPVQTYFLCDGHDLTSAELYAAISKHYTGKKGVFYCPPPFMEVAGNFGSLMERVLGIRTPLNRETIKRLFDEYRFSNNAFEKAYDWHAPHDPFMGIKETVAWHKGGNSL